MDLTTPSLLTLLVLISPAVGSFLAVLADRLPRGKDVVRGRSACMTCGTALRARDLIPVVSFALSAGRCRHCAHPIPPWLLYMELAAIGMAIWAVILGQTAAEAALIAVFLWLLITLIATDLTVFRLPDVLTAALACTALAMAWVIGQPDLPAALLGGALGVASFAALRWGYRALRGREGLGMGDVKLMAGLGAALGPVDLPLMLLLASVTGLAVAVVSGRSSHTEPLPFGAALAAATGVVWILRHLPA